MMSRVAVAVALLLASGARAPRAEASDATLDKKAAYLAAKQAPSPARPKQPKQPKPRAKHAPTARIINLHNLRTNEWLAIELPAKGEVSLPPAEVTRRFLRCHFNDEVTELDERPMRLALRAAQHFKAETIDVISGFRSPKYNLMLRKKGREVARDSQHTKGNAMDIRLPSVTPRQLARWAKAQKLGGVGIYRESGFVHVDTGPIRSWSGR